MKRIVNILLIICPVFFISCDKEDRTYNGPEYVEFSATQFGQELGTDGLTRKSGSIVGPETFVVQQIAYLTEKDRIVNFRIADVVYYMTKAGMYLVDIPEGTQSGDYRAEYSTMKEGIDYSFDGIEGVTFDEQYLKGSVTIGKMESFAYIITNILQSSDRSMYIVLENSDDFIANKYTRILKYTAPQP